MSQPNRICFDKILPRELYQSHDDPSRTVARTRRADGVARLEAIMPRGKRWSNGSVLSVRFLGGTEEQKKLVQRHAVTWSEYANLDFRFDDTPNAEIRISFDPTDGSWSYIGIDCREIPVHAATMNLGWQDQAVICHEFGHAIGLAHEHQNPQGGIQWNDEVVIRDLGGAPNFWDPETVRHNVLEKYRADQINGTAFDADSIMLYAFPGTWTKSGQGTKANTKLSQLDQAFIASQVAYPGRGATDKPVVELGVTEVVATGAAIGKPGEEDLFSFQARRTGTYTVETDGTTDLILKLLGPNSRTRVIAEDDDSGVGSNARISTNLVPGTYYVQVRHYDTIGTGEYKIKVSC